MSTLLFVAEVAGVAPAFKATFPDLPGCVAEAGDLSELLAKARVEVLTYLQALADQGKPWPEPTPIQELTAKDDAMLVLIDITVDDPPVRVNISIGERLLQRIDAEASLRSMTRSGFIAQAVRVSLGDRTGRREDASDLGRQLQDELNSIGQRINETLGPDSAFNRRMTELDGLLYDGIKKAADGVSAAMTRRREGLKPAPAPAGPSEEGSAS